MAIEKPAPWTGASGTEYTFFVFGLEPGVPSRLGNFIYAKRNAEGAWVPVYMGHGDLASCCTDPAVLACIAENAATHLHLRLSSREADRDAELQDLLAHYANAFAPEGCHGAPGAPARPGKAAKAAPKKAKKAVPKQAAPKKAVPDKAATKKATTKKAATKKAATRKAATKKATNRTPAIKPKSPRPRAR